VQARCDPGRRYLEARAADAPRIVAFDQGVVVGEVEERIDVRARAGLDGGADRSREIAEMRGPRGGDSGQDAGIHLNAPRGSGKRPGNWRDSEHSLTSLF